MTSPGTRFGPYEIVAPLGAGGMGEVFQARDTRLNRDVAIKVLPAAFAQDADRRTRFEREAQAVAALSHPNILAIFDTGISDGVPFIVTELLGGETLRERLSTGAMPVRKATDMAMQIARGLAAAHERNLVHRDLKPENVFVLADGQVKILDFGLARPVTAGSGATQTIAAVTDPGSVIGTVGYMSPEQVRGQTVDARTDLFALGCVLYEMLTGRRAFHHETAAETMTAILKEDPPELTASGLQLAPALDRIVRHCLEKNPAERFQTARDVAFALDALPSSGSATSSQALPAAPAARAWRQPVFWAASVVAALAAGIVVERLLTPDPAEVQYERKTFDLQTIFNARFMPDGKSIVYSAAHADMIPELFILRADSVAPDRIGGPGTHLLSVSSKGELAVITGGTSGGHRLFNGTLARMMPGGSPRPWLEHIREADWAPDGNAIAVVHEIGNVRDRLEFPAGTALYEASGYLSDPRVSPDGTRVAFVEHRFQGDDRGEVKVVDTAKHVTTLSGELWGAEGMAWSNDGHRVLFSASEALKPGMVSYQPYSAPVDGRTPATPSLSVMTDVIIHDVAADGRWLVMREEYRRRVFVKRPGDADAKEVSWLDGNGAGILSPDGALLAFTDQNSNAGSNYAVMLEKPGNAVPVRLGEGAVRRFGFSPDQKWVAAMHPKTNTYVFYPTGAGEPRRVNARSDQFDFGGWFSDNVHVLLCGIAAPPYGCAKYSTVGAEPPVPVGPNSSRAGLVLAGGAMAFGDPDGKGWLYPADGRPRSEIRIPDSFPVGIADGAGVYLASMKGRTMIIERFDLLTGATTRLVTLDRPHEAGLVGSGVTSVAGHPSQIAYTYHLDHTLSTLEVASGVGRR
jgi:Tol biopolymer transport system component